MKTLKRLVQTSKTVKLFLIMLLLTGLMMAFIDWGMIRQELRYQDEDNDFDPGTITKIVSDGAFELTKLFPEEGSRHDNLFLVFLRGPFNMVREDVIPMWDDSSRDLDYKVSGFMLLYLIMIPGLSMLFGVLVIGFLGMFGIIDDDIVCMITNKGLATKKPEDIHFPTFREMLQNLKKSWGWGSWIVGPLMAFGIILLGYFFIVQIILVYIFAAIWLIPFFLWLLSFVVQYGGISLVLAFFIVNEHRHFLRKRRKLDEIGKRIVITRCSQG